MIKYLKKHRILYLPIASTLVMFLYIKFILVHFGSCFILDIGSNSLGLSFSYTKDTVLHF